MSTLVTIHDTFVLQRSYAAAPARVFRAFADRDQRKRWFGAPPGWTTVEESMDFRVGGKDVSVGGPPGGPLSRYSATYMDIVPDARIISTYEMYADDRRTSVSVQCIELFPEGKGTRLQMTEHGIYLDHQDAPKMRKEGSEWLLAQMALTLHD